MHRSRSCRFVFIILMLAVIVQPAWGASPGGQTLHAADLLDRLWSALASIWAESGYIADPHGGCTPTDPNGGCSASAPSTDEGCIADPHGGCAPRS